VSESFHQASLRTQVVRLGDKSLSLLSHLSGPCGWFLIQIKEIPSSRVWWHPPLIPHLGGRGRWISEFEASLVYRVSSRTARTTEKNPVSKKQNKVALVMVSVYSSKTLTKTEG
jgi:hypothetical protein